MATQENPYAIHDDSLAAIHAPADARAIFLQKTYSLVLAAVAVFVATLFLSAPGKPMHGMAMALGMSPIITILLYFGGFFVVHWLAGTALGLPLFFAFACFWGLISAPLIVQIAATPGDGATIIGQASLITAFLFTGITAYVFKSGRDFSFLGGFLWMGIIGLLGVALAGWLLGFSVGIWYSFAGAGLMCGFILYDTSNVLKRYPTTAHVSAALVLFTDVVLLFKHVLLIVWSMYNND